MSIYMVGGKIITAGGGICIPGISSYSTTFPFTQNPLSDGGQWTQGTGSVSGGTAWQATACTPGLEYCTGDSSGSYNDCVASLSGFNANQWCQGTIYLAGGYAPGVTHECELHLRCTMTSTQITTYEINIGLAGDVGIARWNGNMGDFTPVTTSGPGPTGPANGDVFYAQIVGNAITVKQNGSVIWTATDSNLPTGNPGIGNFSRAGSTHSSFGWSAFSAGTF